MAAMLLLIASRLVSDNGFDWLAIIATVLFFILLITLIYEIRKPK